MTKTPIPYPTRTRESGQFLTVDRCGRVKPRESLATEHNGLDVSERGEPAVEADHAQPGRDRERGEVAVGPDLWRVRVCHCHSSPIVLKTYRLEPELEASVLGETIVALPCFAQRERLVAEERRV